MSNGLDFTLGTSEGLPIRLSVSMLASFASVTVAEELNNGTYPLVRSMWDYRSTPMPHEQIQAIRVEVVNLIKAILARQEDQRVIDELDDLLIFLKGIESLGLGVHVSGP